MLIHQYFPINYNLIKTSKAFQTLQCAQQFTYVKISYPFTFRIMLFVWNNICTFVNIHYMREFHQMNQIEILSMPEILGYSQRGLFWSWGFQGLIEKDHSWFPKFFFINVGGGDKIYFVDKYQRFYLANCLNPQTEQWAAWMLFPGLWDYSMENLDFYNLNRPPSWASCGHFLCCYVFQEMRNPVQILQGFPFINM